MATSAPADREVGRNAQVARVLQIIRDLDRLGGVDLYELSQRYGTSTRTIRRDLDALQAVGLPLVEEPDPSGGPRKRWRLQFREQLGKLAELLDVSHYLALRVAMGQTAPLGSGSALFAALEDLSDKIERALGPKGRDQLKAIDACFHSYEKFAYHRTAPDVFWPLVDAIAARRLCEVSYEAPRRRRLQTRFEILPLRLFSHDGAVYLYAHVPRHDQVITLNLHRLQSLTVLDRTGTPPAGFDPERWGATAFRVYSSDLEPVTYVLRFSADAAPYIRERVWHPSQTLRELGRGQLELRFTCAPSYEVSAWVASWSKEVEVLRPQSLREQLASLGRWLTRTYG